MTSKTIKTILFASLIAGVIIPLLGMQNAHAESEVVVIAGPEPEIQQLLDRSMDPNISKQEEQQITKELNALGVPTKEQLEKDKEFWTQKVFDKAQQKLLKEQVKDEKKTNNVMNSFLENNVLTVNCSFCPPNTNAAFWSGFWYDCGKSYMCSAQTTQWLVIPQGSTKNIIFYITFPLQQTGVQGWYYAQGPNGSSNVSWTGTLELYPIGISQSASYSQDIDPSVFKQYLKVNNNPPNTQVKFIYSVSSVV